MNERLYKRCSEIGFMPKNICEVGVYKPETSNVLLFIKNGIKSTLIEADPDSILEINNFFIEYENVKIIPYAIWDSNGIIRLYKCSASTFASELKNSPAIANDGYVPNDRDAIPVNAIRFDEIDDGNFDLISIDTEGCEWFVLKYMISKPIVISIEMKFKKYINPYYNEITNWLRNNNYRLWYRDGSDFVYIINHYPITFKLKFKYFIRKLFRLQN